MLDIRVDFDGFHLPDGSHVPVYSGTVHYWRLRRELWPAILDSVREMGFQAVETYVPWGVHELERGCFDWGQVDPAKDLTAFLELCEEREFHVFLRPGPNINAELTYFGFPPRILFDPQIQALTRDGTIALYDSLIKPAPVPSYASERLYNEVSIYFDALFQLLGPHLYPQGRVIGLQADNEMSYFFRPSMFDLDYSPASLALYRRWLSERYGDIFQLNRLYGTRHTGFDQVIPPTGFKAQSKADLPPYLDWARYKEYYLAYGLQRIARLMRERGADGLPIYHNYPGAAGLALKTPYNSPYHLCAAEEALDVCGVDIYATKETYYDLKKRVQYVVGTSRMGFVPEFGGGGWPWTRPIMPDDQAFSALALFMHGLRAVNFYMIVERERWLGSPITRDNRRRVPYFDLLRKLTRFVYATDLFRFRKRTSILLLANRDYERLACASALLSPPSRQFLCPPEPEIYLNEDQWGFEYQIPLHDHQWWRAFDAALAEAGYTFDLSDTALGLDRLNRYAVVIVSCFDFMSRKTQEKLLAYAQGGRTLILGPSVPHLDENMQPCTLIADHLTKPCRQEVQAALKGTMPVSALVTFEGGKALVVSEGAVLACQTDVGEGRIIQVGLVPSAPHPRFTLLVTDLLRQLGQVPEVQTDDSRVEVTVHEAHGRKLVFAANPSGERKTVTLTFGGPVALHDLWDGRLVRSSDGNVEVAFEPYSIKVWEQSDD